MNTPAKLAAFGAGLVLKVAAPDAAGVAEQLDAVAEHEPELVDLAPLWAAEPSGFRVFDDALSGGGRG